MNNRKPRQTTVTFDFGVPVKPDAPIVQPDGTMHFNASGKPLIPAASYLRVAYDRPTKPKILSEIHFGSAPPVGDLNQALLRYAAVFGCDTSTKLVNNVSVSVAAVYELQRVAADRDVLIISFQPRIAFEFRGIKEVPEKVAWLSVLRAYVGRKDIQVALVVDSHLSELADINARRHSVAQDAVLPSWVTLLYASADGGMEYLANKLIAECDWGASKIMEFIEKGRIRDDQGLCPVQSAMFTHVRVWHPNIEGNRLRGYVVQIPA